MNIEHHISLKPYNTFGIGAVAEYFSAFSGPEELEMLLSTVKTKRRMILGGGSNILLTKNYDGLILKNEVKGIEVVREDERHVYLKAGAGVLWHAFVLDCIDRNLAGVENLSLIPGNVGASPMQNIGAYSVEVKDVFHELIAYHLNDKRMVTFSANDCQFGYRESIFKNKYKNQFAILSVVFRLNKIPEYHIEYGAIKEELERMKGDVSIRTISQAVMNIRTSKLPDPSKIGNAGSFFKNPVVTKKAFALLRNKYPDIPGYPQEDGSVKLAAGWLIEQCGWKGYRKGDAGCHEKQALVLVNYGNANGNEILALSEQIRKSVTGTFGVSLEKEVNVV